MASQDGKIEFYTVTPGGAVVSLHPIYCGCSRCKPKQCINCFGAGCFVCLPEFATDGPGEHDPDLSGGAVKDGE